MTKDQKLIFLDLEIMFFSITGWNKNYYFAHGSCRFFLLRSGSKKKTCRHTHKKTHIHMYAFPYKQPLNYMFIDLYVFVSNCVDIDLSSFTFYYEKCYLALSSFAGSNSSLPGSPKYLEILCLVKFYSFWKWKIFSLCCRTARGIYLIFQSPKECSFVFLVLMFCIETVGMKHLLIYGWYWSTVLEEISWTYCSRYSILL